RMGDDATLAILESRRSAATAPIAAAYVGRGDGCRACRGATRWLGLSASSLTQPWNSYHADRYDRPGDQPPIAHGDRHYPPHNHRRLGSYADRHSVQRRVSENCKRTSSQLLSDPRHLPGDLPDGRGLRLREVASWYPTEAI